MKASDAHTALLTCQAPLRAISEFGDAVARGTIPGFATVIYRDNGHEGANAKIKPYWRRVVQEAQQALVWTENRAELPAGHGTRAVSLTEITFDDEAVNQLVNKHKPSKPKRGKKRIQDEWTPFWVAAAQLGKAGMLNVGKFPTQKAFYERLHIMMDATLDEQTIKPLAAILYKQVVEPKVEDITNLIEETD